MAKQVHLRIDENVYKNLSSYAANTNQTMQDCFTIAVKQLLNNAKKMKTLQMNFIHS